MGECLYYAENATEEELRELAREIRWMDSGVYPAAISRVTQAVKVKRDPNGRKPLCVLPQGTFVLFAVGRGVHMVPIRTSKRLFRPLFAFYNEPFGAHFEDCYLFNSEESAKFALDPAWPRNQLKLQQEDGSLHEYTYEGFEDYFVTIIEDDAAQRFTALLQHKDYDAVKKICEEDYDSESYEEFLEDVSDNLLESIAFYYDDFVDEEG